jgi:hypothetical protein
MPLSFKHCFSIIAFGALAALDPQAAAAQPRPFPPGIDIGIRRPQFVVTAVKVHVGHETGTNWPGNDEVEVLFSDYEHMEAVWFYNADAGETFTIPAAKNCIQPQTACDHGVSSVHFRVALWENDESPLPGTNFCYGDLEPGNYFYEHGLCSGDDLIGKAEVTLTQQELVALLPTVGASVDRTIRPTGGDGTYDFTYRITRLPDVGRDIVIGPPLEPAPTISLEVIRPDPDRVRLNWSGATASSVDIYRNGAKIATTPNDGSYSEMVAPGTYTYRVCNAGSTVCSADVTV